jgi:hypothetical protein
VTSPGRGVARAVRGCVLALCCVLLALTGHVLGGGSATSVLPLLMVGGPLAGAFAVWADRQRRTGEMIAAALGSQVALHVVFLLCGGARTLSLASNWDVGMMLGHLVAACAMAWALSSGEAALWTLSRVLQGVALVRVVRLPAVDPRARCRSVVGMVPARCGAGLILASARGRRGPPCPHVV